MHTVLKPGLEECRGFSWHYRWHTGVLFHGVLMADECGFVSPSLRGVFIVLFVAVEASGIRKTTGLRASAGAAVRADARHAEPAGLEPPCRGCPPDQRRVGGDHRNGGGCGLGTGAPSDS